MSDGKKEFVSDVGTNEGQSVDVSQSGSVDVSDRSTRDLGSVDVANAVDVTDDATRDLGSVDVANTVDASASPIPVDDSTPIAVDDQSGGGGGGVVNVVQDEAIPETTVAAGGNTSGTLSPPSGELWEIVGYWTRADVLSASAGSGTLDYEVIIQDGTDYTPQTYLEKFKLKASYEIFGSNLSRVFEDGSANWVSESNATSFTIDERVPRMPIWLTSSMRAKFRVLNNTDATADNVRGGLLVKKHTL